MKDNEKTREQLVHELSELRSQNAELKKSITEITSAEVVVEEARRYAESILETVREPLLVLDADLKIISANRNFYSTFKAIPRETIGNFIYNLGNKQWDIPKLRELLEEVLPEKQAFDNFEVDHNFQDIGHKIMLLNACRIYRKDIGATMILLAIEDITERKRLEDLLTESEERFRRLFETASDGIVLLEKGEGKITHANPATEKMLGYTKKDSIGNKLQDIGVLLDMGDFQTTMQNLNKIGIINYDDVPVETKSGQHIDTEIYLVDRARLVQCNIRDITERKRAVEALRESEEKYRWVLNNMADVITVMDMNLCFTYVSPSIIRMRGYTVEEAVAQTLEQVMTPESMRLGIAVFEEEMQLEASGAADPHRTRIMEMEEYKKDGSIIWAEVSLSFLRDKEGKPVGILMVTRDISERRRSAISLHQSEQNYRLLATYHKRLNDISIAFTEASGTEDLYNIISESLRFLTGAIATTFSVYNKDTRTLKVASLSADPISGGKAGNIFGPELFEMLMPVGAEEMELMLRQGIGRPKDLRELSFGIIPQEISDAVMDAVGCRQIVALAIGHAGGLLGTCVVYLQEEQSVVPDDALKTFINLSGLAITRKQAEEEKNRLEDCLKQAEKMEALGTLAGGISHDFNNLLMGIQGYASLTLLDLEASHPHYERMKKIEEHVESGANLTKQLLGVARGGRYDVIPTDMNDILEKSSSMFGRTKKELSIYRKSRKDLWPVEIDRGQMEQVFMNLYVNAWQSMPLGGEISLETENVILNNEETIPYAITHLKYVKISVTDTGMGMDEKTMKRIFDPFFTTKKMGQGTGLGLATVYGIIKRHNGMIHVDSKLGHGTTFTIFLPASEKKVVKEGKTIEAIVAGMETILLVDDEKMIIEVNKELLTSMGYRIYACGCGQEAIAIYMEKHKEIDLVILDMIMPGISGGETFDRLREINPGIRVLLSSGYSINGQAQEILDRGCNGFIQKPFRLELLSRKVREILD